MNLFQKQRVEEIQRGKLADAQDALNRASGMSIPLELDFDSLCGIANEADQRKGLDFAHMAFEPAVEAVKQVCRDAVGKEAVARGLKGIRIVNDASSGKSVGIYDGVLLVKVNMKASGIQVPSVLVTKEALEKSL